MKKSKDQEIAPGKQSTLAAKAMTISRHKPLALNILMGLFAGIVAAWFVGIFKIDFSAPLRPTGDYVVSLFQVKSLLNFGTVLSNPNVAFPLGGNFASFPTPDILVHIIIRTIGLFSQDPLIVLISYLILCFVGVTLSSFLALRLSGVGLSLSFMSAIVYGVSAHMTERAPLHPWLCLLIVVPWICRLCLLIPYQRARLGRPPLNLSMAGAIIVGVAAGLSGTYWAFFGAMFLVTTLLIFVMQHAPQKQMNTAIASIAAIFITFLLAITPTIWEYINKGNHFPSRNLFFQSLYGIHLPDVFLPKIPVIKSFYNEYTIVQNSISTEGNYTVLELWGVIGLIYGLFVCLRRLFPNLKTTRQPVTRRAPTLRMATFLSMFGLLFAMPYGLGFIFNMLFSGAIRSQNRIGVFLLFFALMMAAPLFEKARKKMSARCFWGMICAIFLLTITPSFEAISNDQNKSLSVWKGRETSMRAVISELDKNALVRIAQYPSQYFPEAPTLPNFGNTEHFLPYVLDKNPKRKWSFGSMPYEDLWQKLIFAWRKPVDEWMYELRFMGYDAVLIEKRALVREDSKRIEELHAPKISKLILYEDSERLLLKLPKEAI